MGGRMREADVVARMLEDDEVAQQYATLSMDGEGYLLEKHDASVQINGIQGTNFRDWTQEYFQQPASKRLGPDTAYPPLLSARARALAPHAIAEHLYGEEDMLASTAVRELKENGYTTLFAGDYLRAALVEDTTEETLSLYLIHRQDEHLENGEEFKDMWDEYVRSFERIEVPGKTEGRFKRRVSKRKQRRAREKIAKAVEEQEEYGAVLQERFQFTLAVDWLRTIGFSVHPPGEHTQHTSDDDPDRRSGSGPRYA